MIFRAVVSVRLIGWLLTVGLLIAGQPLYAQGEVPAAGVKAAFLYKFLSYIDLPETAFERQDSPVVLGVAGADDIHAELTQIVRGHSVGERPVIVRRLTETDSPEGLHLLYVGPAISLTHSPLLRAARQLRIPFVTESPDGLAEGSLINFLIVRQRVRFEVSLPAAERASVRVSSRMLALAERVVGVR